MVGGSELAFRLLCRKYGSDLCYTPMMSSVLFASDASYREKEFQTTPADHPVVAHFSANDPEVFTSYLHGFMSPLHLFICIDSVESREACTRSRGGYRHQCTTPISSRVIYV